MVGGISRTVERDGWRFDIGGHRFFTKVQQVDDLWHEILPHEDFLMRPRKSRIFYDGKYFDYPLAGRQRPRATWARSRPSLCVVSYAWARHPPAQGPDQLRGLAGRPLRLAPLPDVLQDLHREALGRPVSDDARRLGGAAGQGPLARQRHPQRPPPEAEPEGHHLAHRGVPVPEVRARDDVGGLPRQGRRAGLQGRHGDRRDQGAPRRRPGRSASPPSTAAGAPPSTPCTDVISSMPMSQLLEAMDPPVPDEVKAAADGPALPRLHDRGPGRAARPAWTGRQLDLHPRPRASAPCGSRTSARGRPTW